MGAKKKAPKRVKNLAAGRPPTARRPVSLSRKTTKRLINTHHQLEKRRQQAITAGDVVAQAAIAAEIEALGGLERYQQASLQGQRDDRGGDSSRVLMKWLEGVLESVRGGPSNPAASAIPPSLPSSPPPPVLRMLEVGALSTKNACSASGIFCMERIDLHSQSAGILQQDFLQRPLPRSDAERFDIISLSLVLNYVPQHSDRGKALLRCLDFLYPPGAVSQPSLITAAGAATAAPAAGSKTSEETGGLERFFPSVFMVLPEPCVSNSRYLTEEKLVAMMAGLGFDLLQSKTSQRLVYYLWKRVRPAPSVIPTFRKKEIRTGPSRNNFSIVLDGS